MGEETGDIQTAAAAPQGGRRLGLLRMLRCRLGKCFLRFTRLWPEIRQLSQWLEETGLPEGRRKKRERVCLTVEQDADGRAAGLRACFDPEHPLSFPRVARLLSGLGIEGIELDVRLESNQIADVLSFVYTVRRALARCELRHPGSGADICGLWEPPGLQMYCTNTQIRSRMLVVVYSYCTTCMSRVVLWFMRKQRRFSDHRALFTAAPKYGLAVGLIALVPFVLYRFLPNPWLLLAATASEALVLGSLVYFFFMTAGGLEYDNEDKAHRLERANVQLEAYARRTGIDLRRARTVQQRLLPEPAEMPLGDRLAWAASFDPETEVGGDYFDAALLDARRVAVIFTDVSGHGMSAAFITAILKTAFQQWIDAGGAAGDFLKRLNLTLRRLTPDDSFAALFLAVYDPDSGELSYVNCGHNPEPWRIPADPDRPVEMLTDARATLLGVLPQLDVQLARRRLAPGDTLLMVTDGIVEARNRRGEFYGVQRFERFLAGARGLSAQALTDRIVAQIDSFAEGAAQSDDRTILAMRVRDA